MVFAKFLLSKSDENELMVCVDEKCNLMIFDVMKLKRENLEQKPMVSLNLFANGKIYEEANTKNDEFHDNVLLDSIERNELIMTNLQKQLLKNIQ